MATKVALATDAAREPHQEAGGTDRGRTGSCPTLADLGPGAPQKIKTVAAGALVDRLHAEQRVNRAAWDQMIAAGAD